MSIVEWLLLAVLMWVAFTAGRSRGLRLWVTLAFLGGFFGWGLVRHLL